MPKIVVIFIVGIMLLSNGMTQTLQKKDSVKYELHLSSTAILSGGNLERVVLQNRLSASIGNQKLQFITENSYRYGRNFTRVVENDALTRNYIRILTDKKIYGFVLGTYEDNFKRSIENRWQLGGGAAYHFFEKNKNFLRTSLAFVYEQATYKSDTFNITQYNGHSLITEARGIVRLGGVHSFAASRITLRHDTWYMLGLKNSKNNRWHSLIGLQVPIYKALAFKTDYEYTYENVTISNKNPFGYPSSRFDWVLTFGLSYDIR